MTWAYRIHLDGILKIVRGNEGASVSIGATKKEKLSSFVS